MIPRRRPGVHRVQRARLFTTLTALLAILVPPIARAGDPPWLREVAVVPVATVDAERGIVIVLAERQLEVAAGQRLRRIERGAMRVVSDEGRQRAVARVYYDAEQGAIRDLRAWVVDASGKTNRVRKEEIVELAQFEALDFSHARVRVLSAREEVDVGDLFAYEATIEEAQPFLQFDWAFQSSEPTLISRLRLQLPPSWTTRWWTFNHPPVEPEIAAQTYVWELCGLPGISAEPLSPPLSSRMPRLAVSCFPPEAQEGLGFSFRDWSAVSLWVAGLNRLDEAATDVLAKTALAVATEGETWMDTLRALAGRVQEIRYAHVPMGLERGGGYRARPPEEVVAKGYGDCKDKANLMRGLLRALGRDAYLMIVRAGDSTYVQAKWPSPVQFDHCIVAIPAPDDKDPGCVIRHPRLGPMLLFDPTDPYTPFGHLPESDRGGMGLLIGVPEEPLVVIPGPNVAASCAARRADLEMSLDGSIEGTLSVRATGDEAARLRALAAGGSMEPLAGFIRDELTATMGSVDVACVETQDGLTNGSFLARFHLRTDHLAQRLGVQGFIARLSLPTWGVPPLGDCQGRRSPILLPARCWRDTVILRLPEGGRVESLPPATSIHEEFAQFDIGYLAGEAQATLHSERRLHPRLLPAAAGCRIAGYLDEIHQAESRPVVLALP